MERKQEKQRSGRLKRNQEKAVVAGVLAGLADYFEQDRTLFRIAAIIFLLITGVFPGLLFYIVAWFMMPRKLGSGADFDYEIKSE